MECRYRVLIGVYTYSVFAANALEALERAKQIMLWTSSTPKNSIENISISREH